MRNITEPAEEPPLRRGVDRRTLAIAIAAIGAACLLLAAFSKSWMGNPSFGGAVRDRDGRPTFDGGKYLLLRGDIRFGPLGFEHCAEGGFGLGALAGGDGDGGEGDGDDVVCSSTSTAKITELVAAIDPQNRDKYTSSAFSPAGWIAFGACLVTAAALLVAAALAYLRQRRELPVSPASVALLGVMVAMAAGCVFIATKPGPAGMLGVDIGFWAFGAGTVLGIVGAQLLAKEIRPVDPDLLADAMSPDDFSQFPTGFAPPAAPRAPTGGDSAGDPRDRGGASS